LNVNRKQHLKGILIKSGKHYYCFRKFALDEIPSNSGMSCGGFPTAKPYRKAVD
jgi:hypothetical protein